MGSEEATYSKLYYHFNTFWCLYWEGLSNYAAIKKFSVKSCASKFPKFTGKRLCWSSVLVKLQNCIAGGFQWIFRQISELLFYKTTTNCYFETKKRRCKYWSSIVLLRVRNYFRKGKV